MSEALAYKESYETGETNYMLHSEVRIMRRDVNALKDDVATLKSDVKILKSEVSDIKHEIASIKTDILEIKSEIKESRAELKGDINTLYVRMNGTDKRIDDLHQSQTKWFMLLGVLVAIVPIAVAIVQSFIAR